jgi:hypothetical protein
MDVVIGDGHPRGSDTWGITFTGQACKTPASIIPDKPLLRHRLGLHRSMQRSHQGSARTPHSELRALVGVLSRGLLELLSLMVEPRIPRLTAEPGNYPITFLFIQIPL